MVRYLDKISLIVIPCPWLSLLKYSDGVGNMVSWCIIFMLIFCCCKYIKIKCPFWPSEIMVSEFEHVFFLKPISCSKLDAVAPLITNPPPTSFIPLSEKEKQNVTCDTWHLTCDMWHVTAGGRWTCSQNVSSKALTVWERRYFEDISTKDDWVT